MRAILPTVGCPCGYCSEVGDLHRAAMVRLVVAQQWGVAIRLQDDDPHAIDDAWSNGWDSALASLSEMPCAVDVINDLMGAE